MKLTNLTRCILVESDPTGDKRITEILYNESEFNELVQTKLMLFINSCKKVKELDFVGSLQKTTLK